MSTTTDRIDELMKRIARARESFEERWVRNPTFVDFTKIEHVRRYSAAIERNLSGRITEEYRILYNLIMEISDSVRVISDKLDKIDDAP